MTTKIMTRKAKHGMDETQYFPRHTVAGVWFDFQIKKQSPKGAYFETVVFRDKNEAKNFLAKFITFDDVLAWEKSQAAGQ